MCIIYLELSTVISIFISKSSPVISIFISTFEHYIKLLCYQ